MEKIVSVNKCVEYRRLIAKAMKRWKKRLNRLEIPRVNRIKEEKK
jgi:hypothetical protein